jgi:hypothetical protein
LSRVADAAAAFTSLGCSRLPDRGGRDLRGPQGEVLDDCIPHHPHDLVVEALSLRRREMLWLVPDIARIGLQDVRQHDPFGCRLLILRPKQVVRGVDDQQAPILARRQSAQRLIEPGGDLVLLAVQDEQTGIVPDIPLKIVDAPAVGFDEQGEIVFGVMLAGFMVEQDVEAARTTRRFSSSPRCRGSR